MRSRIRSAWQGGSLGQFEAAVGATRVGLWVVDRRSLFSGEHSAEPVPLHFRHVLDKAGQRDAGRRHGRDGGPFIVQTLALPGQGDAVKVKPAFERGALVNVQGRHTAFDGAHRSIVASGRSSQRAGFHQARAMNSRMMVRLSCRQASARTPGRRLPKGRIRVS
jgi:hypothetical protein